MKWYKKLQFARKVAGLSLKEVKKKIGISDAYLSQIENGKIEDPSYFKIRQLLMLYNLNYCDIEDIKSNKQISSVKDMYLK